MKIVKRIMLTIIVIIVIVCAGIALFISFAPQFGRSPEGDHLNQIKTSDNYQDGEFINLIETKMDMGFGNILKTFKEFITAKNTVPNAALPVKYGESTGTNDSSVFITWYGHSALLLEMEGKRILLDPMFGPAASPVSFFSKRFPNEKPINLDWFTHIDAIIISHDHYDHLDYKSILKLKDKVKHFYVPLGVGSHLQRWGVSPSSITELDWWESAELGNIILTATPARHFSGRSITDRNKTLWASWVLKGEQNNIYFSGDGGYGPHFKEIGNKFGPFNFTMVECGQYNEKWEAIHMLPEQSVQANIDLKGKVMMPIHWGAFTLAMHAWDEPVKRLLTAADQNNVKVVHPIIGERFSIDSDSTFPKWWEEISEGRKTSKSERELNLEKSNVLIN